MASGDRARIVGHYCYACPPFYSTAPRLLIEVDGRAEYLSLHAGEVFYRAAWEQHGYSPASFVEHARRGTLLHMEFSHPCDICRRRLFQQELDYAQRGRVLVTPTPWAQDVDPLGTPVL